MAGNADAQFEYGEMLVRMEGAPRHLNEVSFYQLAYYWYQKAARQGLAEAQYRLAQMNLNGQSGGVDYRTAFIWASLAKAQGHEEAGRLVEQCMNCLDPVQQANARKAAARLQAQIGDPGGTTPSARVSKSKPADGVSAEKS
jgi:TPR repeat protein